MNSTNINENPVSCLSQKKRILAYMKAGHGITGLEALELFGCFRLPARIADIREDGHVITSQTVHVNGKRVKRYYLGNE